MTAVPLLALIAAGLALLVWLQRREKAAFWQRRRALLADCLPLFEKVELSEGADGFPRLAGEIAGQRIRAELLPDTLTLRRLPQLWLSLTVMAPLPADAVLGALVRPSGNEFYARTPDLPLRLDSPKGFPDEVLVRGGPTAAASLALARRAMAGLLADPKVKEVLAMPAGLRVIYQVAEGRRGQHLLLRQCDFGDVGVAAATFLSLHDGLQAIASALQPPTKPDAPIRRGLQA